MANPNGINLKGVPGVAVKSAGPVPINQYGPKVAKKSDWRMWKAAAFEAHLKSERLERELEIARQEPTHIWKRIKIYWFGNENFLGKLLTRRKCELKTTRGYNVFLWIFKVEVFSKYVRYRDYDGGSHKDVDIRIRVPFTKSFIEYRNTRSTGKRNLKIEKYMEGEATECCSSAG